MKLKGKVVIITGSSSGIGEATALLFAKEGARVVVNSRKNVRGGKSVVEKIKKGSGDAIYVQADVSDPKQVKKLFQATLKKYKSVDILINNAGAARGPSLLKSTKKDWLREFDDNLFSTVLCSKEATGIMYKQGSGKILNTASIRGLPFGGRQGIVAYSAAKAAVINFTKTLAKELAPNINVNAVAPGFVKTPPYDNESQELIDTLLESTHLKKWIKSEEIAEAFLYLATADAVTGEVLIVDAGYSLKRV